MLTLAILGLLAAQDPPPTTAPPPLPAFEKGEMRWTGVLDEKDFAALHELTGDKAPEPEGEMVEIGEDKAYLSLPDGKGPFPAILVIHEWWGLNDHIKHWADRLAADGYAALAVDLYAGVVAQERAEALAAMQAIDEDAALAALRAAHEFLVDDERIEAPRTACIGWCFGGGWSLQLAIAEPDLDAAVVYYGRLISEPSRLERISAPMLAVFGNQDRGIPPEQVDAFEKAMKKARRELKVLRYDANHAFANPSSARYQPESATAAWTEVRKFLDARLNPDPAEGRR